MNEAIQSCIASFEVSNLNNKGLISGIFAAAAMLILILDGKTALLGAQAGISLCLKSILPSLFPFLVFSRLFVNSATGAANLFLSPLCRFCRVPTECGGLLFCGCVGGYPSGAQCIAQAYQSGHIDNAVSQRMLFFSCNAGPAFLFGIAGRMFSEPEVPWMLWLITLLSSLLCSVILPEGPPVHRARMDLPPAERFTKTLHHCVITMACICGWVVLFRILIAFCQRWFLWIFPAEVQVLVMGLLELSNGCCSLDRIPDEKVRFVLCSILLAFGGVCVLMQTVSVLGTLSARPYLAGKIMQALFSGFISLCLVYGHWFLLAVFLSLTVLCRKKTVANMPNLLYNTLTNLRRHGYAVSKKDGTFL